MNEEGGKDGIREAGVRDHQAWHGRKLGMGRAGWTGKGQQVMLDKKRWIMAAERPAFDHQQEADLNIAISTTLAKFRPTTRLDLSIHLAHLIHLITPLTHSLIPISSPPQSR
jgi:hypothetical protein